MEALTCAHFLQMGRLCDQLLARSADHLENLPGRRLAPAEANSADLLCLYSRALRLRLALLARRLDADNDDAEARRDIKQLAAGAVTLLGQHGGSYHLLTAVLALLELARRARAALTDLSLEARALHSPATYYNRYMLNCKTSTKHLPL